MSKPVLPERTRRRFLILAFFCFAGINIFFSTTLLLRAIGLPLLVLISPYLDWSAWALSGILFAWVCLTVMRSQTGVAQNLGYLPLMGSVLLVLSTVAPGAWLAVFLKGLGGILMACAVFALTAFSVWRSGELLAITTREALRLLLTFFFALVIPLQIWSVETLLPFARPWKPYPHFDVYQGFEVLLRLALPITSGIFVLLITSWLWSPLLAMKIRFLERRGILISEVSSRVKSLVDWRLMVGLAVALGVFVSGFQWLRGIPLGQDSRYYVSILQLMEERGIQAAFSTERPFFFLSLYAVQSITGFETSLLLRLLPVFLATLSVVVTYWFVRVLGGTEWIAALASILTAVSPHIIVAVEIYIVANWLGVVLMMLFLGAFLKGVSQRSAKWTLITVALSGLTLGFHYFTWLFTMTVLAVYFLESWTRRRLNPAGEVRFSAVLLVGCFAVLLPVLLLAYSLGGGLLENLRLAVNMVNIFIAQASPGNFVTFLLDQEKRYNYFGREHYAAPLFYLLGLVGSIKIASSKERGTGLLRCWLIAACLGILVIHHDDLWRFLHMIPLEILAGIGLSTLLSYVKPDSRHEPPIILRLRRSRMMVELGVFSAFGILLAYSGLPSIILLLGVGFVLWVESKFPESAEGQIELLLTAFIVLEETARALYALT